MSKLILHIGSHKTGSSSLQKSLIINRKTNEDKGWYFHSLDKFGNSSNLIKFENKEDKTKYHLSSDFKNILNQYKNRNLILSGEHFFLLNKENKKTIKKIKSICDENFDEVKIVVYLRRQDKLALSFKQQASKGSKKNQMISSVLCGHSSSALPELTNELFDYLNFGEKIEYWEEYFSKENMIVADFDNLYKKDICLDFKIRTNIDLHLTPERVNSGVSKRFSLISHKLIQHELAPESIIKIRKHLDDDNNEKVMANRNDVALFLQNFNQSNNKLKRYNISFDDDLEKHPNKESYFFNNSDLDALFNATKQALFDTSLSSKEIDEIRDSALMLEKTNIKKAYALMKIAQRLRPNGSFINKKVRQYKSLLESKEQ